MDRKEGVDNHCVARAILLDLSKAIDYIPHYLTVAKMTAYGFNFNDLKLIFPLVKKELRTIRPSPLKWSPPPSWKSINWYWKICQALFFSNAPKNWPFHLKSHPAPYVIQNSFISRNSALIFSKLLLKWLMVILVLILLLLFITDLHI